jgi:hypothetical protein
MKRVPFTRRQLVPFLLVTVALAGGGCSKGGGAAGTDGATDGSGEHPVVVCPEIDPGPPNDDAGVATATDEFGPNAPAAKAGSSLGRVNIFEVTSPTLLDRVDVYLRADLDHTRLTIAVQEATTRTSPFQKLTDIQIDVAVCQGWASSGPLAIPMEAGRFYAMGFDPNQPVSAFVSADADTLPIDGAFGRLIGSKTATSVSVSSITWDKLTDKEYNRQRLVTSPRAGGSVTDGGATDSGGDTGTQGDGGVGAEAGRDTAPGRDASPG